MPAVDLADVVNAANVLVRNLPRHAYFAMKTRECRAVAEIVVRQELERYGLAELSTKDYTDPANLWWLFCHDIAFGVVHRDLSKRRHLVLHLLPIADDHDRGAVSVEVFGGRFLNVGRRQRFDPRSEYKQSFDLGYNATRCYC